MREKVSKRILGFSSYVVGLGMAVVSGLEWYSIDSNLVLFVLGNGTALLGIDTWGKQKENQK